MHEGIELKPFTGNELYHYHKCRHTLTMKTVHGKPKSKVGPSAAMQQLMAWGTDHETRYAVKEGYKSMPDPLRDGEEVAYGTVLQAMQAGEPRLLQVPLRKGRFKGVADLLRRVPGASRLGDHHYEVGDVKSSVGARTEQVMQVLFYTLLLEDIQGVRPEHGFLILADQSEWRFRVSDYWDYFLAVLQEATQVLDGTGKTEALWQENCLHCMWNELCLEDLRGRQDLSLVPGITPRQRTALMMAGITSEAALEQAAARTPVRNLSAADLARLQAQAHSRKTGLPVPLESMHDLPQDPVFVALFVDFARQKTVFALAMQASVASPVKGFFVDTLEEEKATLDEAWEALTAQLERPWVVWGERTWKAVQKQVSQWPRRPEVVDLEKVLDETWALPVQHKGLSEVVQALGFPNFLDPGGPEALRYHLYLADKTPALREGLEQQLQSEVAAVAYIHQWWLQHTGGQR